MFKMLCDQTARAVEPIGLGVREIHRTDRDNAFYALIADYGWGEKPLCYGRNARDLHVIGRLIAERLQIPFAALCEAPDLVPFDGVAFARYRATKTIATTDVAALMATVREHYAADVRDGDPAERHLPGTANGFPDF